MLDLGFSTPPSWLEAVFSDFGAFLADHAACERKASATGMWFVVRYPDRPALVEPLIEFSKEELSHFQIVYREMKRRGVPLVPDYKDPYVNALRGQCRPSGDALLLDRLLVAGVVEARGCERLFLVGEALKERDPDLARVYLDLGRAESRHHGLFLRLAREQFPEAVVDERARELLDFEAELTARLPHRPAVH